MKINPVWWRNNLCLAPRRRQFSDSATKGKLDRSQLLKPCTLQTKVSRQHWLFLRPREITSEPLESILWVTVCHLEQVSAGNVTLMKASFAGAGGAGEGCGLESEKPRSIMCVLISNKIHGQHSGEFPLIKCISLRLP